MTGGTAFTSNDFKEYCSQENIEHALTTTGVPRGNGQIEIMNKTIKNVLTKLSIQSPEKWYKHVGKVQTTMNSSYQRATCSTPFEVMFGKTMNINNSTDIQKLISQEMIQNYYEQRENIRLAAKNQTRKIKEENKKYYDKRRKKQDSTKWVI